MARSTDKLQKEFKAQIAEGEDRVVAGLDAVDALLEAGLDPVDAWRTAGDWLSSASGLDLRTLESVLHELYESEEPEEGEDEDETSVWDIAVGDGLKAYFSIVSLTRNLTGSEHDELRMEYATLAVQISDTMSPDDADLQALLLGAAETMLDRHADTDEKTLVVATLRIVRQSALMELNDGEADDEELGKLDAEIARLQEAVGRGVTLSDDYYSHGLTRLAEIWSTREDGDLVTNLRKSMGYLEKAMQIGVDLDDLDLMIEAALPLADVQLGLAEVIDDTAERRTLIEASIRTLEPVLEVPEDRLDEELPERDDAVVLLNDARLMLLDLDLAEGRVSAKDAETKVRKLCTDGIEFLDRLMATHSDEPFPVEHPWSIARSRYASRLETTKAD